VYDRDHKLFSVEQSGRHIAIATDPSELARVSDALSNHGDEIVDGWHAISARPEFRMVEPQEISTNRFMSLFVDGKALLESFPPFLQRLAKAEAVPLAFRLDSSATEDAAFTDVGVAIPGLSTSLGARPVAKKKSLRTKKDLNSLLALTLSKEAIAGLIRIYSPTNQNAIKNPIALYSELFEQIAVTLTARADSFLGINLLIDATTHSSASLLPGIKSGIDVLLSATGMLPTWKNEEVEKEVIVSGELPIGIGLHLWQSGNQLKLSNSKEAIIATLNTSPPFESRYSKHSQNPTEITPLLHIKADGIALFQLISEAIKNGLIGDGQLPTKELKHFAQLVGLMDLQVEAQQDTLKLRIERKTYPLANGK
jgi:hypothetical protein